jgi:hypothetical protein
LDHKVVLPDGNTTLNISAEPSAPPQTTVNEEMVEKIKVAMSDRYVSENKGNTYMKAKHIPIALLNPSTGMFFE